LVGQRRKVTSEARASDLKSQGEKEMLAEEFGTGQVFWSMLWFFLFFIWIWLLITVFADIFRSPDLSGGAKAAWSIFVIFLPYLGVFVYLIARGKKMGEHAQQAAQAQDKAFRSYVKEAAGTGESGADQLAKLAQLHDQGVIDDAEYARMKAKVTTA
jgi:ABC-type Fe3+ transport system permease subunit